MTVLNADLLERAARLSSATFHEASGKRGALPATIKPLAPNVTVCGRAFPVLSPPGDNLWLHRGIYAAGPGDVLVVDVGDGIEHGYWGEVMAVAAQVRGIAGLVLNGGVRDSQRMIAMGFPVFSAAIAIRGTGKDPDGHGSTGAPVRIGDVDVHRGDLVFGDADGVFILTAADAEVVIAESERRDAAEQTIFARLRAGESSIAIYDLPQERS